MAKTYVIGDIHGHYNELVDVLTQCNFDYENDKLISLGDVCDRGPYVVKCIRELKKIKHLVYCIGNHCDWAKQWLTGKLHKGQFGIHYDDYRCWHEQGGAETIADIEKHNAYEEVYDFLDRGVYYHEEGCDVFVHGGLRDPSTLAMYNAPHDLMWDRSLIEKARLADNEDEDVVKCYDRCFIGHTPVLYYETNELVPVYYSNVIMVDGGVFTVDGELIIMDVNDTKKFWVSNRGE